MSKRTQDPAGSHERRARAGRKFVIGLGAATAAVAACVVLTRRPESAERRIAEVLSAYRESAQYDALKIEYPYDGTIFPPEAVPPTFRWGDDRAQVDVWLLTIEVPGDGRRERALVRERKWTPPAERWAALKKASTEREVRATVLGVKTAPPLAVLSRATVTFSTSADPVGAPLFYREVNLPFLEAVKDPTGIRWRFGAISSAQPPPVVLEKLPVCGNCHSFSADGKTLGLDVDYANDKGSYAIARVERQSVLSPENIISWSDFRRDDRVPTFGLLSQVSPDGRFVVATVKDRSVFVPRRDLAFSQLFFPIQGILAVYRRETGAFSALPGADAPAYVQSNPSWSPDGKYIVFARAKSYRLARLADQGKTLLSEEECKEFLEEGKTFQFDLYRIPFNDGAGGTPEPLAGASANGESNYFAKYSPDGAWIVFCRSKSFMLLQPDSALYIIPAAGGEARRLRANRGRMNSWHSWSPNGRWLVFSSKERSPYTQLFLTHIDARGESSPPVVLDNLTAPDRAANIPEFVNASPDALHEIRAQFVNETSYVRVGSRKMRYDDVRGAIEAFQKALSLDPNNKQALVMLGQTLYQQGKYDEAEAQLARAARLYPTDVDALRLLGAALTGQGKRAEALDCMRRVLAIDPENAESLDEMGMLLIGQEQWEEGLPYLYKAAALGPDNFVARYNLGATLVRRGKNAESIEHLTAAVRLDPAFAKAHYWLGVACLRERRAEESCRELAEALRLDPTDGLAHVHLGFAALQRGEVAASVGHYEQAVKLVPGLARSPGFLNGLGTAYGAAGDYAKAMAAAERALSIAEAAGDTTAAEESKRLIAVCKRSAAAAQAREKR